MLARAIARAKVAKKFNQALIYEKENKYKKAEEIYSELCQNDIESCYRLAVVKGILENKEGYNNEKYAIDIKDILTKNCQKNHAKSCRGLANRYKLDSGERSFDSIEYFYKKACSLGDARACLSLIDSANSRYEFDLTDAEMQEILVKTCNAGVLKSCKELNMKNISNEIYKKSVEFYTELCLENDLHTGCLNLADLYENGLGVQKDLNEAFDLYSKVCESKDEKACYKLGLLYEKGLDSKPDYQKAIAHYDSLCNDGNAFACERLGYLYKNGLGVAKKDSKARFYYGKAMGIYEMIFVTAGHDEEEERYKKLEEMGYSAIY